MTFALRLKELREKKHLSQKQLADELGVGNGTVGMWESSERIPPAKRLKLISNYFGVSVDYLLGYEEFTPEERAAGFTDRRKISITPIEDDMIYVFRQIGERFGEQAQRDFITVGENMLKLGKK